HPYFNKFSITECLLCRKLRHRPLYFYLYYILIYLIYQVSLGFFSIKSLILFFARSTYQSLSKYSGTFLPRTSPLSIKTLSGVRAIFSGTFCNCPCTFLRFTLNIPGASDLLSANTRLILSCNILSPCIAYKYLLVTLVIF